MCCQLGSLWIEGDFESRQELQKVVFPSGIFLDKENGNYRTISLSQMSKGELACTLPWREIEGEANLSLSQTSKGELACTLPWREIEGEANLSLSQTNKVKFI